MERWDWHSAQTEAKKKETEGLLMAAQDQALRTNAIKGKLDKQKGDVRYRMCKNREETEVPVLKEGKCIQKFTKGVVSSHWKSYQY